MIWQFFNITMSSGAGSPASSNYLFVFVLLASPNYICTFPSGEDGATTFFARTAATNTASRNTWGKRNDSVTVCSFIPLPDDTTVLYEMVSARPSLSCSLSREAWCVCESLVVCSVESICLDTQKKLANKVSAHEEDESRNDCHLCAKYEPRTTAVCLVI